MYTSECRGAVGLSLCRVFRREGCRHARGWQVAASEPRLSKIRLTGRGDMLRLPTLHQRSNH